MPRLRDYVGTVLGKLYHFDSCGEPICKLLWSYQLGSVTEASMGKRSA